MDSFATLKRRTTDLFNSIPQSLPSVSSIKSQYTSTMKGTWERISVPPLPRSSHSLDIVAGTAYIFGGEGTQRQPTDNDMHAVTLPFSSAPADYYAIKAKASTPEPKPTVGEGEPTPGTAGNDLDDVPLGSTPEAGIGKGPTKTPTPGAVPAPRVGHATAVIGNRIFLFGGRGVAEKGPLDERGRVWAFDTKTHLWSHLDPAPPADPNIVPSGNEAGGPRPTYPAPRSGHAAVATDKPSDFGGATTGQRQGGGSWREWAKGDSDKVGTPQRPIVGNVAAQATDADADGFGTLIIHGGSLASGALTSDTWAFDVRTRIWKELPPAPGGPRRGSSLCISKSRLYRFGGLGLGPAAASGRLDVLDLAVETMNDQRTPAREVGLSARGPWRTLARADGGDDGDDDDNDDDGAGQSGRGQAAAPLARPAPAPRGAWPGPRGGAALEALNVGGGREYLLLGLGERESEAGAAEEEEPREGGGPRFWDDVWVFQAPPQGMSAASVRDALMQAVGRGSGEGGWTRVEMGPFDDEDDDSVGGPGPRGWVASGQMGELEEGAIVVWGGVDGAGRRLGDGWILRLG